MSSARATDLAPVLLKEIEARLQKEKTSLEKELAKFATKKPNLPNEYDAFVPQYGDEEDDNAREVAEFTTNKPLEMSLENTLRDIDKALLRLSDGTYGTCKYCGQAIGKKRLLARPTSSSCIDCKKTLTQEA